MIKHIWKASDNLGIFEDLYNTKESREVRGEGVPFCRVRRITGYLTGDVGRWNNGKKAELKDRVKHNIL